MRTCFLSMHSMIMKFLRRKPVRFHSHCPLQESHLLQALRKFFLLANEDENVPNLSNNCQYSSFRLLESKWQLLQKVEEVLEVCFIGAERISRSTLILQPQPITHATQSFSSNTHPTMYRAMPVMEFIMDQLEQMQENLTYTRLKESRFRGCSSVCAGEARSEEFPRSRPVADKSRRLLSYAVSPVRRYARQGWGENLDGAVKCGGSQKV
jgi:hypothetical protein